MDAFRNEGEVRLLALARGSIHLLVHLAQRALYDSVVDVIRLRKRERADNVRDELDASWTFQIGGNDEVIHRLANGKCLLDVALFTWC